MTTTRNENPISFDERYSYIDWLVITTHGNALKYVDVIEKAIYPDELSKVESLEYIKLMQELKSLLEKRYPDNSKESDLVIKDKMLIQIEFALSSINSVAILPFIYFQI